MKKLTIIIALLAGASLAQAGYNVTVTHRMHTLFGGGNVVYVDGKPFAKLACGKSITFSLNTGEEHMISIRPSPLQSAQKQIAFEAKPNKHNYFRIDWDYRAYAFNLERDWNGGVAAKATP